MFQVLKKNWFKNKIITLFGIVITLLILITLAYKSDNGEIRKQEVFKTLNKKIHILIKTSLNCNFSFCQFYILIFLNLDKKLVNFASIYAHYSS